MDIEKGEPADEWLMIQLQGGDGAALAVLMQRWEIPVKRFIFRLVGNTADAEDLAQEVFVRVFLKRHTYRAGARFSPWIFAIAANQAKNRLRWWKRRPTLSLSAWLEEGGDAEDETTASAILASGGDQDERMAAVQRAVSDLPLDQRTAIVLFEYEEKSMAEVAEIVGCSAKAVENRLYRARQQLRRALENGGMQRNVGPAGVT
ncbi:MAG: sigma-70 family RNA polymerase sigma factor [Opitutaceae bacterium]|jgi:RNA polymerase sigma-70 factor (ECF subfamily)